MYIGNIPDMCVGFTCYMVVHCNTQLETDVTLTNWTRISFLTLYIGKIFLQFTFMDTTPAWCAILTMLFISCPEG